MTAHYIHAMLYKCDGSGCSREVEGTDARLPEGWTVVVEGKGSTHWYGHRCPACATPEPKEAQ